MEWIILHIVDLLNILTAMVTVASLICALTATPKDDQVVGKIYKIVEFLAINIGKAKQK